MRYAEEDEHRQEPGANSQDPGGPPRITGYLWDTTLALTGPLEAQRAHLLI